MAIQETAKIYDLTSRKGHPYTPEEETLIRFEFIRGSAYWEIAAFLHRPCTAVLTKLVALKFLIYDPKERVWKRRAYPYDLYERYYIAAYRDGRGHYTPQEMHEPKAA